ncbi:MAG: terminase family protein [Oscillospiraceae bacterium]|nr:terminase family protein [Oscillospiraceae bacterium]
MELELSERQLEFVEAGSFEVLFGGAAGGGKSYGQIIDAFVFALTYSGSRQLILRRTRPELERTLIRAALALYPKKLYEYAKTEHTGRFVNGSLIEFGYCDSENDVYRYQSAEYDVIRFDELTHFSEHMYLYLSSRVRGANGFPKQLKSTTNPGGLGHDWVKRRFIDPAPPRTQQRTLGGTRVFIPSRVDDNVFLTSADPGYKQRLKNLPEAERLALLEGEWNLLEGRYFSEWSRGLHVCRPFELPEGSSRFFTMDYGLDMLAGYWIALLPDGRACVYREVYESSHIISSAAKRILELSEGESVCEFLAPPDLWNRRQESGQSAAEIFLHCGVELTRAPSNRVAGWYALKEWLKPLKLPEGGEGAGLFFFDTCLNAIRCLPLIARDAKNPNDCAVFPHELTHAPDALRYFAAAHAPEFESLQESAALEEAGYLRQIESLIKYKT